MLDSDLHILCSPIKSAMDFLYCHSEIETNDSQVRVAFEERTGSTVNEMEILQLHSNTQGWMLAWRDTV